MVIDATKPYPELTLQIQNKIINLQKEATFFVEFRINM